MHQHSKRTRLIEPLRQGPGLLCFDHTRLLRRRVRNALHRFQRWIVGRAFQPATNDSFEVELRYRAPANRIGLTLSADPNQIKDEKLFDFVFTRPMTLVYFLENRDYGTKGVELGGQVELAPGLIPPWGVSARDTKFVNTPPGSPTLQDGNEVPLAANLADDLGIEYCLQ